MTLPVLRHYNVFNALQCDGIKVPDEEEEATLPFNPIAGCTAIVEGYKDRPAIEHRAGTARYIPSQDQVLIPEPWSILLVPKAIIRSSSMSWSIRVAHESRLDRPFANAPAPFGSFDYGKEELVAEMGAAFLDAVAGVSPPTIEQSASYIDNWRKDNQSRQSSGCLSSRRCSKSS